MPKWWDCTGGGGAVCGEVSSPREVTQSQYSLVPCDELTPRALQLWLSLPDEIRNDPALEPFRQLYEREHAPTTKRLPSVKSAPDFKQDCVLSESDDESKENGYAKQIPNTSELSGDKNIKNYDVTEKLLPQPISKLAAASSYVKITTLVACWLFFTVVFLMYSEKSEIVRNTSVSPGQVKSYNLNVSDDQLSILVKLSGPFITEQAESKMNWSGRRVAPHLRVWLERHAINDTLSHLDDENVKASKLSEPWLIMLKAGDLDFNTGTLRSTTLRLGVDASKSSEKTVHTTYFLHIQSNAPQVVPFSLSFTLRPLEPSTGLLYSVLLLCGLYGAIIFEIINRTMAAVLVSTTSLAVLALVGERPSLPELMSWLDVETLMLLFSMMILVAIMAETGIFDFLAVYAFEATRGKIWALINLLNAITAIASTFLDNVTTVLLMTPVTIRLCEVTSLDPVPILMAMVLYTNIGGAATPVGDPPNVIIATNKAVAQAGIHFTNFTLHMTLGCLLVCVQTYFQLRYWHIDVHKLRNGEPKDIQELRRQISIWARAADSLPQVSRDEQAVYERLQCKVRKLSDKLCAMQLETKARACSKDTFHTTLAQLKAKYKIRDKVLLVKASVAMLFVIIVFFLHSIPEFKRISLAWTALLGALLLLVLADREDLEPILHRVEWSTLIFFAALFVLMEALSKLGLIDFIGGLTEAVILNVHESGRLAVAILLMLWVCGIASAFIDNIPLTTMMVRVVTSLGSNPNLGLPMAPLVWALSFGACLGGNGTLIGASANVLCAGVASQHGYRFSFVQFFKIGFPIMIGHLLVASAYLLLCHCVFTWH